MLSQNGAVLDLLKINQVYQRNGKSIKNIPTRFQTSEVLHVK